ncbi:SoxY-related AACIE arm protein [Alcaligenaceae bacterium LF4-65]|uniref:SoxY-related AACIE arm protein n=1 Tax=Zwartia hollandica TaxID=324606 RepID=A0A953NEW5_9BURK|nr:SoxY-related AACIE arm protein [Zwartia hollandica]MBZ1351946.1 SoxY-related AACIE arm protein [Zwartia hollandica]
MTTNRRTFVMAMGAVGLASFFASHATEDEALAAMKAIMGSATPRAGKVTLELPALVENGNLVTIKVSVESPMTQADHVKAVHLIAEGNPLPNIVSFFLGPRAGRAEIGTRIRLANSQRVWAIAQMSDGSFWRGYAETLVTLAACTEVV